MSSISLLQKPSLIKACRRVALLTPSLPTKEELFPFLEKIDCSKQYTNFGPLEKQLQKALRTIIQTTTTFSLTLTSSGTLALQLALQALQLPKGAHILLPTLTFAATASAVIHAGYTPIFCHVDPTSGFMTPDIVKECLTKAPFIKAIIPVTLFAEPFDPMIWDQVVSDYKRPVIIDAASAIGNQVIGKKTHTIFSFHATKPFTTAEGGAVVSSDRSYIEKIRSLTNFGFIDGEVHDVGTNAKISEYHAAIGLASLLLWPEQRKKRKQLELQYQERLKDFSPLITPLFSTNRIRSTFPIRCGNAKQLQKKLLEKGIETRKWYTPMLHHHPAYQHVSILGEPSSIDKEILSLPFHLFLQPQDLDFIFSSLQEAIS